MGRYSKLAIWSFALSLIPFISFLLLKVFYLWIKDMPFWFFLILVFPFLPLISLIMGFISLYNEHKYKLEGKLFSIVGVIINLIIIVFGILLFSFRN